MPRHVTTSQHPRPRRQSRPNREEERLCAYYTDTHSLTHSLSLPLSSFIFLIHSSSLSCDPFRQHQTYTRDTPRPIMPPVWGVSNYKFSRALIITALNDDERQFNVWVGNKINTQIVHNVIMSLDRHDDQRPQPKLALKLWNYYNSGRGDPPSSTGIRDFAQLRDYVARHTHYTPPTLIAKEHEVTWRLVVVEYRQRRDILNKINSPLPPLPHHHDLFTQPLRLDPMGYLNVQLVHYHTHSITLLHSGKPNLQAAKTPDRLSFPRGQVISAVSLFRHESQIHSNSIKSYPKEYNAHVIVIGEEDEKQPPIVSIDNELSYANLSSAYSSLRDNWCDMGDYGEIKKIILLVTFEELRHAFTFLVKLCMKLEGNEHKQLWYINMFRPTFDLLSNLCLAYDQHLPREGPPTFPGDLFPGCCQSDEGVIYQRLENNVRFWAREEQVEFVNQVMAHYNPPPYTFAIIQSMVEAYARQRDEAQRQQVTSTTTTTLSLHVPNLPVADPLDEMNEHMEELGSDDFTIGMEEQGNCLSMLPLLCRQESDASSGSSINEEFTALTIDPIGYIPPHDDTQDFDLFPYHQLGEDIPSPIHSSSYTNEEVERILGDDDHYSILPSEDATRSVSLMFDHDCDGVDSYFI